ncbi:tetratricopeptide repeat-containing sensor histidine kinase [Carboxylicivirga linearis]|uniref:Tetratricopeptide repeat protein n=1 Tax=Carboxylicivirga linearis TaxID=1628157 RepID=A0ABS5JWQ2_9BACT|nr:tetratricopeptide repeat protein [Carboxylicivirga linearis]MBS2099347.1 tetratricopeptide repeat protein [Carboxylicivirga linearis]
MSSQLLSVNWGKTILLGIILSLTFFPESYARGSKLPPVELKDSLVSVLTDAGNDTLLVDSVYALIKIYRRQLKDEYKNILVDYINYSSDIGYTRGAMRMYDRLGLNERYSERFDSAVFYHHKSLELAIQLKDSFQMAYNYNNIGQAYRLQDMNSLAIKNFHKALDLQEANGNDKGASFTQNTLGAVYVVQKEYDQAMHYFRESQKTAKHRNDLRTQSYNLGAMGEVYMLQNQPDSAILYFTTAKDIKLEMGDKKGLGVSNHLIGQAYFNKGDYFKAESYLNGALNLHLKYHTERYIALCYDYLGKIKLKQNKYDEAADYLLKAKSISTNIHSYENLLSINSSLKELYQNQRQWPLAMQVMVQNEQINDSIYSLKKAREMQALEIEYETEKREQQIKLLSAENEIKEQRLKIGIAIIALLVLTIGFWFFMQKEKQKRILLERDKVRQQLLRSQMNPHFLFNALGSIQSYMYQNDVKTAARYMGNFASLTRSILNNSAVEQVSLDEEISTLKNYLELEKMRLQSNFQYSIEVPEDIDVEFVAVPPMLIQPFVENAIKHGIKNYSSGGKVKLAFEEKEDLIHVVIEDNGEGINTTKEKGTINHKSMATTIFKQRMKIIRDKFPNVPEPVIYDLSENDSQGTRIDLYLPILELSPILNS